MSERFGGDDRLRSFGRTFHLEELDRVETRKLDDVEKAAIERAITERERVIHRSQADLVALRSERDVLAARLADVERDREELRERIRESDAERPAVAPEAVFANLGSALETARDDLAGARYTIGDVDFTLKTNVVQTDRGLRMHLPSMEERSSAANLSEISFRLRGSRDEAEAAEYVGIPDLVGATHETARRRLASANLEVGETERVSEPGAQPGTVLDQFPDADAVAPPGATVDLVIADERDDLPGKPEGAAEADLQTENSSAVEGATGTAELESKLRERLQRSEIDDVESLVSSDPAAIAEALDLPVERIEPIQERLLERHESVDLRRIDGIGPTYAERLREAGIDSAVELAGLDPSRAAEITQSSRGRAERWIEQARSLHRSR